MELFTFVVSIVIMIVSMQYGLYWMMLLVGGVLIYLGKSKRSFIIVSVIMFLLYVVDGTPYQEYNLYIAAIGIVIYMVLDSKGGPKESYDPNDQYADLLKGLGG